MKLDVVMAMPDEELERRTLDLLGWKQQVRDIEPKNGPVKRFRRVEYAIDPQGKHVDFDKLPNFPRDLPAVWELEEAILSGAEALRVCYARALVEIVRLSKVCHASPRNITRAYVYAMTQGEA